MKTKREFLENPKYSNSWYKVNVDSYDDSVELTLADCSRAITWYFGSRKGKERKRGKAKIAKLKKLVDSIYEYYHENP